MFKRIVAAVAATFVLCAVSLPIAAHAAAASPSPNIVAWGDSLTAGAWASQGNDYPSVALRLLGGNRKLLNMGIGGQQSTGIAALMNAVPTWFSVAGNQIAASGATTIVRRNDAPINDQGPSSFPGTLCGVHGTLSAQLMDKTVNGYAYVFTRDAPGTAADCPPHSTFLFDAGVETKGWVNWLWLGRNGAGLAHSVRYDIAATVAASGGRFVIASLTPASNDSPNYRAKLESINAWMKSTYGRHYIDVDAALMAANDGSAGDLEDVRDGIIPRSLRHDPVHLTDKGYAIVAKLFADATRQLGY